MPEHPEEVSPALSAMVPVFVIVCLLAAMASCGVKQSRLKKQAAQAIEQAGFEKVDVAFKGKTAVLSGSVDGVAALDELRELVSDLTGVRRVRADAVQIDQAPAAEPAQLAVLAHPVEPGAEHVKAEAEVKTPAATSVPEVKPEAPGAGSGKKESSASEGPVPKVIPLAILVEDEGAGEGPPGKKPKPGAGKKPGAKKSGTRKPVVPRAAAAEERVSAIVTAMKADAQLRVKVISSSQYPYEASDVVKRARARLETLKAALVEAGVSGERIELVLRANLVSSSKVERSHIEFHLY
jgi:hypothetical protein